MRTLPPTWKNITTGRMRFISRDQPRGTSSHACSLVPSGAVSQTSCVAVGAGGRARGGLARTGREPKGEPKYRTNVWSRCIPKRSTSTAHTHLCIESVALRHQPLVKVRHTRQARDVQLQCAGLLVLCGGREMSAAINAAAEQKQEKQHTAQSSGSRPAPDAAKHPHTSPASPGRRI